MPRAEKCFFNATLNYKSDCMVFSPYGWWPVHNVEHESEDDDMYDETYTGIFFSLPSTSFSFFLVVLAVLAL